MTLIEKIAQKVKGTMSEYVRDGYIKDTFLTELCYSAAQAALNVVPEDKVVWDILVGGNHLASALIGRDVFPEKYKDYDDVLHKHGSEIADMWVAHHAIGKLAALRAAADKLREGV